MGTETKIQWADHTFNPWRGCTKVSPGCKRCYAEAMSRRNPAVLGEWGPTGRRAIASENYWRLPLKWNREAEAAGVRRRVFCASLADVFEDRPELVQPRQRLVQLMHATEYLDWLVLTKRPENIEPIYWRDRLSAPRHLWLGVSVENQQAADERLPRLARLWEVAEVLFLSFEPLLGPIRVAAHQANNFDWIIIGGESGPHARPMHGQWLQSLLHQFDNGHTARFFKQWGEWLPDSQGGDYLDDGGNTLIDPLTNERFVRVGKKLAGNVIDGRTYLEFPR